MIALKWKQLMDSSMDKQPVDILLTSKQVLLIIV